MFVARIRAALGLAVALGGLTMVGATAPAQAEAVLGCHASDLAISKGRLDAAAGQRFQDIKIRNVTDRTCRLTGIPKFRWQRHGNPIGWGSTPAISPAPETVLLQPGDRAWTTLRWSDPGPIPPRDCRARHATGFTMTLPARPHVYRIGLGADVCTTKQYRPSAYPLRDGRTI